jgi:hypothetical protein
MILDRLIPIYRLIPKSCKIGSGKTVYIQKPTSIPKINLLRVSQNNANFIYSSSIACNSFCSTIITSDVSGTTHDVQILLRQKSHCLVANFDPQIAH